MSTTRSRDTRGLIQKLAGLAIMLATATLLFVGAMSASATPGARLATCSALPDPPAVTPTDGGFQGGLWSADTPTSDYHRLLISCEPDA